ncbi:MAG: hypothetical protein LBL71_02925 [Endomicrobium sp.]|jgi:hypothetical protein|nr:hypothetical protein [Endomicrobium sp.]
MKTVQKSHDFIDYNIKLGVQKELFSNIDLSLSFFDSLKKDYKGFPDWFIKKSKEKASAYICNDTKGELLGFLYLKIETDEENYDDIFPMFSNKKRLKIGTFKVCSTGFRLGERFIKIIFDNAVKNEVDEIYVTMFEESEDVKTLCNLFIDCGFVKYGEKRTTHEIVFIKKLGLYNSSICVKKNFPNISYNNQKFIVPIYPKFHTPFVS